MYGEPLSPEQQQQAFLSRLLLMLGSFVIMCLVRCAPAAVAHASRAKGLLTP